MGWRNTVLGSEIHVLAYGASRVLAETSFSWPFFWRSTQSQLLRFCIGGVPACCHGPMLPLPSLCPYFDMVHNPPCTPPTICLDVPGDLIGSLLKRAVSVGRVVLVWSCAGFGMVLGWLWWSWSESVFFRLNSLSRAHQSICRSLLTTITPSERP